VPANVGRVRAAASSACIACSIAFAKGVAAVDNFCHKKANGVDDPCFGFAEASESSWSDSCGGDWGDYDHGSS
jgi:hypothetical protein